MRLAAICKKVRQRLPGGSYAGALMAAFRLRRKHPGEPFYRKLLRLNLRAYFCVRPHYGPLLCDPAVPAAAMYHRTKRENLSSVKKNGIKNRVTGVVFLAESPENAVALTGGKALPCPVLLKVDSGAMLRDGYTFFINRERPQIWLTERVPPEYLRETDSPEA